MLKIQSLIVLSIMFKRFN